MAKKDYSNWTKEELLKRIKQLEKWKKCVYHWIFWSATSLRRAQSNRPLVAKYGTAS